MCQAILKAQYMTSLILMTVIRREALLCSTFIDEETEEQRG